MSRAEADSRVASGNLEDAWVRLLAELHLNDHFWLGIALSADPRNLRQLEERARSVLRAEALGMEVERPAAPVDLEALVPVLLRPRSADVGLIWIEAVAWDAEGDGAWAGAWRHLLERLNEQ